VIHRTRDGLAIQSSGRLAAQELTSPAGGVRRLTSVIGGARSAHGF
jgi:hypothetical protein